MKQLLLYVLFLHSCLPNGKSNENLTIENIDSERKVHQIIETRSIYLNGGLRSQFGGNSRVYIKIDLPPNTVQWYYSFSTSAGESGTQNLNLGLQLSSLLVDSSGLASSTIEIPEGSNSIDVYLCDWENIQLFKNKTDNDGGTFYYMTEGTVQNTRHALVEIDDIRSGSWYLGLKNPSELNGVNVTIEVVAISETSYTHEKKQKAEMYGNLGWSAYENGNYLKCIEYCNKAHSLYKLGWVEANKGLSQLVLGYQDKALATYIEAIVLVKKQEASEYVLSEMIKDLRGAMRNHSNLVGAKEIIQMIKSQ